MNDLEPRTRIKQASQQTDLKYLEKLDAHAPISNQGAIHTLLLFRNVIPYSAIKQTIPVLFTTTNISGFNKIILQDQTA